MNPLNNQGQFDVSKYFSHYRREKQIENYKIYQLASKFEFTEPKQLVKLVRKEEMKRL